MPYANEIRIDVGSRRDQLLETLLNVNEIGQMHETIKMLEVTREELERKLEGGLSLIAEVLARTGPESLPSALYLIEKLNVTIDITKLNSAKTIYHDDINTYRQLFIAYLSNSVQTLEETTTNLSLKEGIKLLRQQQYTPEEFKRRIKEIIRHYHTEIRDEAPRSSTQPLYSSFEDIGGIYEVYCNRL